MRHPNTDPSASARTIPLADLLRGRQPRFPDAPDLRNVELAAAEAAGDAGARAELLPRIQALEEALGAAQSQHAASLANQARLAEDAIAALDSVLAAAVVPLALDIAARVLEADPDLGAETAERLVSEALSGLADEDAGMLRLHPGLAAVLPRPPAGWRLLPDPALAPGEVVAERGPHLSRTSLDLRLARIACGLEAGA